MPLTLILGPANSAKAGEVLGAYADAARRGALLVVPTALDAEHYGRELAADGAVLGSVLTFAGLARELGRRAGYGGRRLSALQREWVLRRAVARASFSTLARSAAAPGFLLAAGNLIAELQRSLVSPQRLKRALEQWASEDGRREQYARDLAALYFAYARELERLGRVDAELYAWRALDALRAAPGRWGADAVFFYGFDDLTALERDAVETLARIAGAEVTVSLTYEPARAALLARAQTVAELRPIAERVVELPAVQAHYEASARPVLHHLERRLFEPGGERVPADGVVRLLESGGERAEAELLAAEVLEVLRGGTPAEEVVVVYRSVARAAPLIERVFGEYGIPLASERRVPFAHTALGRGLLGLARCALLDEGAAKPEDLLDYLRTPGLLDRPELADALEATVRRDSLQTAAQARERLALRLQEIDSVRGASSLLAEIVRQARRLFALPHLHRAPTLGPREELDARALAILLRACAELEELGGAISAEELIALLERLEVPAGARARPGAVLLADPLAIRARRFRAVFVCGLQEGEFPLAPAPDPFLPDDRRRELAACAGLRLPRGEDDLARERYLLYACVSRATERLVLSYRSSDEEGNVALSSPFVADVAELLDEQWRSSRRRRLLADVVWPAAAAPTARERARADAAARSRSSSGPPARTLGDGGSSEPLPPLTEVALRRMRHREIVSAGALESYADCPVKWLVERELQPQRLEPDADPVVRGEVMHAVLEETLRRLAGPVTRGSLPAAERVMAHALAEQADLVGRGRPEGVRAAALRAIEADLRRYLEHEAGAGCSWTPEGLELRFGFEDEERESLGPLELGEGVALRGVIDRLDVEPMGGTRAIVRDYKSGSARSEHPAARWQPDRQLQVALYMLAVQRLLGLEPVAGVYQPLGGADLRARGMFLKGAPVGRCVVSNDARDAAELEQALEDARQRAISLARRLRSGELTPCPQTCSKGGCLYPGICRVE